MRKTFSVFNSIFSSNMLTLDKTLKSVLLLTIPFLRICCTQYGFLSSCIRYETYQVIHYEFSPYHLSDFFHYRHIKRTRIGIRSRRIYGCIESQLGSTISNTEKTTEKLIESSTAESTSEKPPCNGPCAINEECSASDDICICRDGFQRTVQNASANCVPKCEPECKHADCTAPNTCICWPHYERRNDSFCQLQCSELTCAYGECDENGTCICASGFLNNGTSCVWAGDAILSAPDDCDCWSKFVWQKNRTQDSDDQKCLPLCKIDDPTEVDSDCIHSKLCQCYEGFLVCHSQIFKCLTVEQPNSTTTAYQAEHKIEDEESSVKLTLLIVAFLVVILVLGGLFWLWEKHRRGNSYNQMGRNEEEVTL